MAVFYLIRHGQTDWNVEHKLQGQKDIPMNDEGIRQMNDLADKLAETGLTFDLIISSPLDRAKTSAEIIAEKIKYEGGIICDPGFWRGISGSIPIIQGNVLCCEKIHGKEPRFYVLL